jgi:hypothetical protein
LEALVSSVIGKGARHGAMDQVHLDNAEYACSKAIATKSAIKAEKMDVADADKAVLDAELAVADRAHPPVSSASICGLRILAVKNSTLG